MLNSTARHLRLWLIGLGILASATAGAQDPRRMMLQADSLVRAGKAQKAVEVYDNVIKSDPSARAYLGRAKAWTALDRSDRAVPDLEQALRMDSTVAEAHYQRAVYAMRANDGNRTVFHTTKAITFAKDTLTRARSLLLRGEAKAGLKQTAMAIEDMEQAMALGQTDAESMRTLAMLYDTVGRHADALIQLERLCEVEPRNVGNWSNRAFELTMLERYEEALSMAEKALTIDKDEPIALSNRAYLLHRLGRDKEAWQDVERSLRAYPANPYALRTRALLRLQKGEREKACEDLNLAKALGSIPEVDRLLAENCSAVKPKR